MKRIGIVGYFITSDSKVTFGIPLSYYEYFSKFGAVEIISHNEKTARDLDLLVIPGGPDVDTNRYLSPEEEVNVHTGSPCIFRERFDRVLLPKYVKQKTPIFGICRGHQTLAVFFGAKLNQHMSHESNGFDRKKTVHDIIFTKSDFPFEIPVAASNPKKAQLYTRLTIPVNSIHHQTVASAPENGKVIARHSTDHEIEAISYIENYPAFTVQWHPEEIHDILSKRMINYLLTLKKQ